MRETPYTNYIRDDALYNLYKDSARADGLPIMNNETFERLNKIHGKEKMRLTLADYVASEKPRYPLKHLPKERMIQCFNNLRKYNINTLCTPSEKVKKTVLEKYDDYKYPYSEYGLGLICAGHSLNDVSSYFHQDLRLACGSYGHRAPKEVWENGTAYDIWKYFGPIWRGINDVKKVVVDDKEELIGGDLVESSYISSFRLGGYVATQFKPVVAKAIYNMTNARTVLDTSCGWGDRLAGFFASNAEEYYGCDPNPNTYERYQQQISTYNKFLPKPKKVKIWNCGAEDMPYNELPKIDCAFTSPPYFSTERYNEGGDKEELQSWSKYSDYETWRDEFYLPVAQKSFDCLNDNGVLMVNILDPKINGKRYRSGDELVDMLLPNFMGQVGMRIMQRPQGATIFQDDDGIFDKEAMVEFMNQIYIENVWCFSKNKKQDIFKHTRKNSLDDIFG